MIDSKTAIFLATTRIIVAFSEKKETLGEFVIVDRANLFLG
jgi:hypothetical protein